MHGANSRSTCQCNAELISLSTIASSQAQSLLSLSLCSLGLPGHVVPSSVWSLTPLSLPPRSRGVSAQGRRPRPRQCPVSRRLSLLVPCECYAAVPVACSLDSHTRRWSPVTRWTWTWTGKVPSLYGVYWSRSVVLVAGLPPAMKDCITENAPIRP